MELIAENLPGLVAGNNDPHAWEAVSLAATLGGMVIGVAGVSAAHGMEHPASGLKNIVHGRGLAALTPYIVERLAPALPHKFAKVSQLLGGKDETDCADSIRRFLKAIDLAVRLGDLGITSDDVEWMTENCMKISIGNLKNAPVTFNKEEVAQIYREAI
jgi:alcohol dehydrogenase class IV